ncbi:MAG: P1 family peptidase [Streptococcaceae bacterium]|jgi:L-aminopeptidase/D-esterase-like protein|nr:P1 family peptidase [Streptococcaceae bacterium]
MVEAKEKFLIGNIQDEAKGTGVTVILAPFGAIGGVSVRGGAPGTRETDLLNPVNTVEKVHAVSLSGGSAFGLEASCGVMQYLHENEIGFLAGTVHVPIIPSAVIFDLAYKGFGFPDKKMGYEACLSSTDSFVFDTQVGAGCGATVGKILGPLYASKGGVGVSEIHLADGVFVRAVIVVNAFGEVYDKNIDARYGVNHPTLDARAVLLSGKMPNPESLKGQNTTIGCILTNAKLTKSQANKLADIGHDGFAQAITPVHTEFDGDTLFALASGEKEVPFLSLSTACVEAVRQAIVNAVQ